MRTLDSVSWVERADGQRQVDHDHESPPGIPGETNGPFMGPEEQRLGSRTLSLGHTEMLERG